MGQFFLSCSHDSSDKSDAPEGSTIAVAPTFHFDPLGEGGGRGLVQTTSDLALDCLVYFLNDGRPASLAAGIPSYSGESTAVAAFTRALTRQLRAIQASVIKHGKVLPVRQKEEMHNLHQGLKFPPSPTPLVLRSLPTISCLPVDLTT